MANPILLHEFHGLVRQIIDEETFPGRSCHSVQRRGEVVAPMAGSEPVVFVESTTVWVIRVLHPIVPFAKCSRSIACGFEGVGDGHFIQVHPLPSLRSAVDATASMVAARQNSARVGEHTAHT